MSKTLLNKNYCELEKVVPRMDEAVLDRTLVNFVLSGLNDIILWKLDDPKTGMSFFLLLELSEMILYYAASGSSNKVLVHNRKLQLTMAGRGE